MPAFRIFNPGALNPAGSYAHIACELGRHLARLGHAVSFLPAGDRLHPLLDDEVRDLADRPIQPSLGDIMLGYPVSYRHYSTTPDVPQIGIAMFESTRLPEGWIAALNACDAVVTPSRWGRELFIAHGISAPVHVVPLGVSEVYRPYRRDFNCRPFTFLVFADHGIRKAGFTALQAFLRAFGDREDVRLVLKSRAPQKNEEPRARVDYANVEVLSADLTAGEMYDLYCRCDCLIAPSASEGWGLLPREFASTGGVSLATNWSGLADHIDLWGHPLPYTLVEADWSNVAHFRGQSLGQWARVKVEEMLPHLLDVVERRREYQQRAWRAAPVVRELYDWAKFAAEVVRIWELARLRREGRREPVAA